MTKSNHAILVLFSVFVVTTMANGQDYPEPNWGGWGTNWNEEDQFNNNGISGWTHETFTSAALNFKGEGPIEVGYSIYLPPNYDANGEGYPVLYWLHGIVGDETQGVEVVSKFDEKMTAPATIDPVIIVIPAGGTQTFYSNAYHGKCQVHDYILELIEHIDTNYNTKTDKKYRHIQGFSMGGFGAMLLATKNPDMFGAVQTMGAALLEANDFSTASGVGLTYPAMQCILTTTILMYSQ